MGHIQISGYSVFDNSEGFLGIPEGLWFLVQSVGYIIRSSGNNVYFFQINLPLISIARILSVAEDVCKTQCLKQSVLPCSLHSDNNKSGGGEGRVEKDGAYLRTGEGGLWVAVSVALSAGSRTVVSHLQPSLFPFPLPGSCSFLSLPPPSLRTWQWPKPLH